MQSTTKRFKIRKEKFGSHELYNLSDHTTGEYASILPFMGGSINAMALKCGDGLVEIINGYESVEDVLINLHKSFKGSSLFPFPNRIADGIYHFAGKKHCLPINFPHENNAIHGLVYDRQFEVVEQRSGNQCCALTLRYLPPDQTEGYPFKYKLEQRYQWVENRGLECTTIIENLSNCDMPLGHGWHPYFMGGAKHIDDLALQLPAAKILEVDQRNIPTGNSKSYDKFKQMQQIGSTELDNCFRLECADQYADIIISNAKRKFSFKIRQEMGKDKYNYLQIYTPPERTSIAIEPMTCAPNVFNNKNGLITLSHGNTLSLSWSILSYDFDEI